MKKQILLLFLAIILLNGCSSQKQENLISAIVSNNSEIEYKAYVLDSNRRYFSLEEAWQAIDFENGVPYLKQGSEIQIIFGGTAPDSIELEEYIISSAGEKKYKDETVKSIAVTMQDNKGLFLLEINYAAGLSSSSDDYLPGNSYRGYRLIYTIDNSTYEFAFVIRTDAFLSDIF